MVAAFAASIIWLLFSYDIACKWSINFLARIALAPEEWGWHTIAAWPIAILYLVPKFHLGSHKEGCAYNYSFNYTKNVGRMHGELVETIWAGLNWLQYSTREMGPAHRREVLTEAMNYWNWQKVIGTGEFARSYSCNDGLAALAFKRFKYLPSLQSH